MTVQVIKRDGSSELFDQAKIDRLNDYATRGLKVDAQALRNQIQFLVYDGMSTQDIFQAQIKAAAGLIDQANPDMTFVAARYLLADTYKRVNGFAGYTHLAVTIGRLVEAGRLNPDMATLFDLSALNSAIDQSRDEQFDYLGLQTLVDRYLLRDDKQHLVELPQHFLMRVAMGLALQEEDKTARAIEFYEVLSTFRLMTSTPTLFNSGTTHSQLSSCFLQTVNDQISSEPDNGEHRFASIFGTIEEAARLSKFAGGIGTDWSRVRGAGSHIKSTNGKSSGVIPYLKVYNDTAVGVNQGGKRKGSFAPYLQPWHPDFMDFCELKKEFGDDRLRAHDVYPAAWLPDLFMQRVADGGMWSFFQPNLYPELCDTWGPEFERRYMQLERQGKAISQRPAIEVWRHLLTCLFETGHPWVTFKDECNRRSPQQHAGSVRSSNLCTEITLNTSDEETAVCNLASVNLAKHMVRTPEGVVRIDREALQKTVRVAMRMLDNVIDLNYYPSDRARMSNWRHRPVGLGLMGETEAKVAAGVAFDSEEGVLFSSQAMELISYYAIEASSDLAVERGVYKSFRGSLWSKGILPVHTSRQCVPGYGDEIPTAMGWMAWEDLADKVKRQGMRNSNTMAIAPTATISSIVGTTPCIEPIFEVERVEENISGKFRVVDPCVKYGRPDLLKTVWEIEPIWVIKSGAARQVWIDQSQSLNIFVKAGTRGRDLAEIYMAAWKAGLKTTYYLRTQSAGERKAKGPEAIAQPAPQLLPEGKVDDLVMGKACLIDNPDCEACQ